MWNWICNHPQRVSGLLLAVFGSVQGGFALFSTALPPLVVAGVNFSLGIIITILAWVHKNTKDVTPLEPQ